jgi:hypothetical protein
MGLVFGMICALWLGMALLVRLAADREEPEVAPALVAPDAPAELAAEAGLDRAQRRRAAVAAVAVALAQRARSSAALPPPPTAAVSPWQAVARSNQLRHRGRVR